MIYELLEIGEKESLSPEYLRAALGLKSTRSLQRLIERERAQGKVILSSAQPPGGYYRPETPAEIRAFIQTLENRGNRTLAALESARNYLKYLEAGN